MVKNIWLLSIVVMFGCFSQKPDFTRIGQELGCENISYGVYYGGKNTYLTTEFINCQNVGPELIDPYVAGANTVLHYHKINEVIDYDGLRVGIQYFEGADRKRFEGSYSNDRIRLIQEKDSSFINLLGSNILDNISRFKHVQNSLALMELNSSFMTIIKSYDFRRLLAFSIFKIEENEYLQLLYELRNPDNIGASISVLYSNLQDENPSVILFSDELIPYNLKNLRSTMLYDCNDILKKERGDESID